MSNSVNITGSDFGELTKALSTINRVAAKANAKIDSMFQLNFSGSKLFSSLDALNGKLAVARIRADGLSSALKGLKDIGVVKVLTGGAGGGGRSGGAAGGNEDSDLNAMTKYRRSFVKFQKREADFIAKQRENSANETYKRMVAKGKEDARLKGKEGSALFVGPIDQGIAQKRYDATIARAKERDAKAAEKAAKASERAAARQEEMARKSRNRLMADSSPSSTIGNLATSAWRRKLGLKNLFDFQSAKGLLNGGSGNPLMVSRFGNPGQMPLMSRFRVFQRPFPGSERNPFALGDAANILNNGVYSAGRGIEGLFKGITSAGTDSVRALTGFTQIGLSFATSLGSAIPVIGPFVSMLGQGLMTGLDIASKTLTFFADTLSKAVGGLINFATNLTLGVSGLASRAVQASSALTELKNAAFVYVGAAGSRNLFNNAMQNQAQYGLSATDSLRLMTRIAGQVRQTTGAGSEQAASAAIDIFNSAKEAGSVLNMSLDDIGKVVQSALAGRYTPLRRIGVAVSAPYLDQIASTKGYTDNAKNPFEARMKALLDEIRRQTAPFMGDLEQTQYEFANQQRKLLGMFEGLFVQAGRILEPFAKAMLLVSNTVMSSLYEKLKGFAETVDGVLADMRAGGSGGSYGSALKSLVGALSRAADYVIYFGDKLWESRDAIGRFLGKMLDTISSVAIDLVRFSSKMVTTLASLLGTFDGLIPSLEGFGNVLVGLADFIDRHFGEDRRGTAVSQFANDAKDRDVLKHMEKTNQGGMMMKFLTGGGYSQKSINAMREKVKESEPRFSAASNLIGKGVAQNQAIYEAYGVTSFRGVGKNGIETVKNMAGNLDTAAMQLEKGALDFKALLGDAPKFVDQNTVLQNLLKDSSGRKIDFIPPPEIEPNAMGSGRLSTYFSPAAFRDEIAGSDRGLNAAEETAANTAEMATYLQKLTETASVNSLLSGGKVAYLGA
jgi:uncharacterized protein YdaU (DUF1376 family)